LVKKVAAMASKIRAMTLNKAVWRDWFCFSIVLVFSMMDQFNGDIEILFNNEKKNSKF